MEKFLERQTTRAHSGRNSLNPISVTKIEITNFSPKGIRGPNGFTGEFYQTYKENVIPVI